VRAPVPARQARAPGRVETGPAHLPHTHPEEEAITGQLPPGEPPAGPWRAVPLPALLDLVLAAAELPFLAAQRPRERACVVVNGTPGEAPDRDHVVVAGPPEAG
jgi:hypothetical protein